MKVSNNNNNIMKQSRKKAAKAKKKEDKKSAPATAAPAAAAAPALKKLVPPPPEWKPTMDSLRVLPCIQHLGLVVQQQLPDARSTAAAKDQEKNVNNNSMIGKIPTAVLEHLIEERNVQSIVRKILADEKLASKSTLATSATIRELKERQESQTLATTRAISKHYRRASVQVS